MATSDENKEDFVYFNLGHTTQKTDDIPSQRQYSSGEDNNSSPSNKKSSNVYEHMSVNDLDRNDDQSEKTSKPEANVSGTNFVYEPLRFSDVLPDTVANTEEFNKKDKPRQQPANQPSNINIKSVRNILLISVFIVILNALSSIIAGLVVENIISTKLDEKTKESSRTEQMKMSAEWGNWANWGRCSMSCNLGLRSRQRQCLIQNTSVKEEYCIGLSHQELICMERSCADGEWGHWGPWDSCSVTCGIGIRTRSRLCDNKVPSVLYCTGHPLESDVCQPQACTDGVWSPWSSWGPCSATCNGGIRSRTRNCSDSTPIGRQCLGNDCDTAACNIDKCRDPMVYFNAYLPNVGSRVRTVTYQESYGSSSLNKSSGIFSCSVPGLYYFTVNFLVKSDQYAYCFIRCNIKGINYSRGYTKTGGSSSFYGSASGSVYCHLNIGDYVFLYCFFTDHMFLSNNYYLAFFTGALITPS